MESLSYATDYIPHGGFTYYGKAFWDESNETIYLGWDYAHCDDYMGYYNDNPELALWDRSWTTVEIYEEVKKVIERLNELRVINSHKSHKQEQIEKMAKAMCEGCSDAHKIPPECNPRPACCVWENAARAINAGYINGADFVEWLKENAVVLAVHKDEYISVRRLNEALQEYLKGE